MPTEEILRSLQEENARLRDLLSHYAELAPCGVRSEYVNRQGETRVVITCVGGWEEEQRFAKTIASHLHSFNVRMKDPEEHPPAQTPPVRPDPYHDGDPTDAPIYAAQYRKPILTERDLYVVDDDGFIFGCEEDAENESVDPITSDALVDRGHAEWVWITDGLYFTRDEAEAKCAGKDGYRTYGFATKGTLRSIVRQHTEGQS